MTAIKKYCRLDSEKIIVAHAFYCRDNNHSMVIQCEEPRKNNGKCPKGRKYVCAFGSFVDFVDYSHPMVK